MCDEFSQCYDDVEFCLWTDGSRLTQSAAESACQQRDAFLPRLIDWEDGHKLYDFRIAAENLLGNDSFWIDVRAVDPDNWHWIDGSPLAG